MNQRRVGKQNNRRRNTTLELASPEQSVAEVGIVVPEGAEKLPIPCPVALSVARRRKPS